MNYRLVYQPTAANELELAINWSFEHFPRTAKEWCTKFLDAIEGIPADPYRYPLPPENHRFQQEIRQLLFGKGRSLYRVLFTVDRDLVRVLHIRFPGQPLVT